ncbi:Uncharacterized conserved protein, contains FIST_N domain [Desulfonatronum thiosulfatophilum]|uniref:Uncharacterized conserved protein, contains FIST_N domain n=1 Tax=Desulfonatronum thiosulfatophilum TaxID=617002 RepID=A0A1G6CNB4_9BACT|nr:FIST N-terminal domain-containing protein [Desulfonatronum thiosulfatophilum]SDB34381.1 Uncharacterized conserved protein, contains FIST_N domain [Desulfonatronum thiosulfatophilum]
MITAIGHSNNPVAAGAVEEVLAQCRDILRDRSPSLGILFTSNMDINFQAVLDRILNAWPDLPLVGCTTDGEISDILLCAEDSLCLLLIHTEKVSFSIGLGENLSRDPEAAVNAAWTEAARKIKKKVGHNNFTPRLGLVLAEGLKTFGVSVDQALRRVIGENFPLFGGMAGDGYQFRRTFQFFNDRVATDALILVLISGPVRFSMGLFSGLRPIGKTYAITKHKDNIVWEIDGMPAAIFMEQFLGQRNYQELPQFPLAVLTEDGDFFLRAPVFINKDDSITFVGTFPENPRIRLTEFDREAFIQAAHQTTRECLEHFPGSSPNLALLMPCTSRRHILGSRAMEEHAVLLQHRDRHPKMRMFGMYAYGELGPLQGTNTTFFHNDTFALLLLKEDT